MHFFYIKNDISFTKLKNDILRMIYHSNCIINNIYYICMNIHSLVYKFKLYD